MTGPCVCGTGCGRQALPGLTGLSRACYQRWRRLGYPRNGQAPRVPVDRYTRAARMRAEFAGLRQGGTAVRAAADLLGIHASTARRWESLRKDGRLLHTELEASRGDA